MQHHSYEHRNDETKLRIYKYRPIATHIQKPPHSYAHKCRPIATHKIMPPHSYAFTNAFP